VDCLFETYYYYSRNRKTMSFSLDFNVKLVQLIHELSLPIIYQEQ